MLIGVINKSSLVSDRDAYDMTLLVNYQLRQHAAPAFDRLPPEIHYFPSATSVPAGAFVIAIGDNSDQAGALGYHALGYGRVFAEPVLQAGGGILAGELSVCSVLSHEALESFGDIYANLWGDTGNGTCYAYELGDPVESDSYSIGVRAKDGTHVQGTVSDFVLPSWFDPAGEAPFDYLGQLTAPFEVRQTGYVIAMTDGNVTEQWGERYPEWRKAMKASPLSRTSQRHARATSARILT
jgi:hypothetical protein